MSMNIKRWYVVQVYTGYEETVKKDLEKRIEIEGLGDLFGQILVPAGESAAFALGEAEEAKKEKIFPGYVLVQMVMSGESYRLVMTTPRVSKFLGGDSPMPLSQKEVDRIFSQISGKIAVSSEAIPFSVGNEITIANGPFSGFVGIVDNVDEEHQRLTVMVSIFGRLTPVELSFNQVKK